MYAVEASSIAVHATKLVAANKVDEVIKVSKFFFDRDDVEDNDVGVDDDDNDYNDDDDDYDND